MSTVPAEIAGLGSSAMKLRVSPGFDPLKAQVGPEEYFVLSRIDGTQTMREVLLQTGPLGRARHRDPHEAALDRRAAAAGRDDRAGARLAAPRREPRDAGRPRRRPAASAPAARGQRPIPPPVALARPGRCPIGTPRDPTIRRRCSGVRRRRRRTDQPAAAELKDVTLDGPTVQAHARRCATPRSSVVLPRPTDAEKKALAEQVDLSLAERLRILAMARLADGRDPWALLGVEPDADAKTLKRAYFKLSKEIHPDRYYGKQLGSFGKRLATVFEAVSRAYARLTTPEKKRRDRRIPGRRSRGDQPQTPQDTRAAVRARLQPRGLGRCARRDEAVRRGGAHRSAEGLPAARRELRARRRAAENRRRICEEGADARAG